MTNDEKYSKMKLLLEELAVGENYDLEKLKIHFRPIIASERRFRRIKTMADLLIVLEERAVLSHESVLPLLTIGELLENEDIKSAVSLYKKIYLKENSPICVCGKDCDSHFTDYYTLQPEGNVCGTKNNQEPDLMDAIRNVAERIDTQWRILTSELNIEMRVIDDIYNAHPKDPQKQAYAALEYWIKKEKGNATTERLEKALNARLCKIKGIGSHLMQPVPHLYNS